MHLKKKAKTVVGQISSLLPVISNISIVIIITHYITTSHFSLHPAAPRQSPRAIFFLDFVLTNFSFNWNLTKILRNEN